MRACGVIVGTLSKEPAGITAKFLSGEIRGIGLPQFEQKHVEKRLASVTLYRLS